MFLGNNSRASRGESDAAEPDLSSSDA